MQVVYQRCCGLDIHKKLIVACLLIWTSQGMQKEIRTFSTMLDDLFRLRDWLKANECQVVVYATLKGVLPRIWGTVPVCCQRTES